MHDRLERCHPVSPPEENQKAAEPELDDKRVADQRRWLGERHPVNALEKREPVIAEILGDIIGGGQEWPHQIRKLVELAALDRRESVGDGVEKQPDDERRVGDADAVSPSGSDRGCTEGPHEEVRMQQRPTRGQDTDPVGKRLVDEVWKLGPQGQSEYRPPRGWFSEANPPIPRVRKIPVCEVPPGPRQISQRIPGLKPFRSSGEGVDSPVRRSTSGP